MTAEAVIDRILEREGDRYTNDPKDAGGPTRFGVTQAALTKYLGRQATIVEVMNLTRERAKAVYVSMYYAGPGFDQVADISQAIAAELTDTGVNCGPAVATQMLQRVLNAFNNEGKLYADIGVDGACGQKTLTALRAYLIARGKEGEAVMLVALNGLQAERYIRIAETRSSNENWVYGWLKARVMEAA